MEDVGPLEDVAGATGDPGMHVGEIERRVMLSVKDAVHSRPWNHRKEVLIESHLFGKV